MKKVLVLAAAAFLLGTGVTNACDGKKCGDKKECGKKECCKKGDKKAATTAPKTAKKA
ncbi:MAG: hypothetical protein IM534_09425 [Chitinophagaceae bacterium]|jgi:hypothetical protein|nr:hypothetical protein [Chitinophagaceae bacterium]MCE2973997.1 hypothetical protein [Sediminibacterium sp.]MCA6473727.1 hypothetical protein [Chitinophagaceae bacterium]MCA6481760.1 hypothetical protein [Chitinophagaceae bacterium]MCA6484430.1 hypothetical protein [Chitinophagaceae bacterium]